MPTCCPFAVPFFVCARQVLIKEHDPNTDLNPQKFFFQKENEFYRTIDDDILQYEDTEDNQARPKTQG